MQPRTLQQIITELDPTFAGQRKSLEDRANLIPGQIASEEAGLGAKQEQAFGNILSGARRRGLGFSGIPVGEQAQYTASEFLPAVARLRQSGQERAFGLQDAILGTNERRDTLGQQIFQGEQDRAAQQAASQRAAAAQAQATFGAFNSLGLGGQGDQSGQGGLPKPQRTQNGGFNFFDIDGQPVNAAQYVAIQRQLGGTGTYRNLLQMMANEGDSNAKIALNYVGDDAQFGNAPAQFRGALSSLGATGSFGQPQRQAPRQATQISTMPMLNIPGARR